MSNELIFGFHSVEAILAKEPERFIEIYALTRRPPAPWPWSHPRAARHARHRPRRPRGLR